MLYEVRKEKRSKKDNIIISLSPEKLEFAVELLSGLPVQSTKNNCHLLLFSSAITVDVCC